MPYESTLPRPGVPASPTNIADCHQRSIRLRDLLIGLDILMMNETGPIASPSLAVCECARDEAVTLERELQRVMDQVRAEGGAA